VDLAAAVEAGSDQQVGPAGAGLTLGKEIAGKLLGDEGVEGFVVVEGPNDPVAVTPGVGAGGVEFVAVGLGPANNVKPVLSPAFAGMRRRQEALDDTLVGVGSLVAQKGGDLFKSRGQTGKRERDATEEGRPVGLVGGRQARLLQPGLDKGIDGGADAGQVPNLGRSDVSRCTEGPVRTPLPCPTRRRRRVSRQRGHQEAKQKKSDAHRPYPAYDSGRRRTPASRVSGRQRQFQSRGWLGRENGPTPWCWDV
jgi:hypothetical protein